MWGWAGLETPDTVPGDVIVANGMNSAASMPHTKDHLPTTHVGESESGSPDAALSYRLSGRRITRRRITVGEQRVDELGYVERRQVIGAFA